MCSSDLFDYEDTNGTAGYVTVSHDGGDTVAHEELYVRGAGFAEPVDPDDDYPSGATTLTSAGSWPPEAGSGDDSAVVSGDRIYIGAMSDYEFDVVYEAQEGQSSSTLASSEGPDA